MDNYQTEIIKLLRRVEQKYAKPLKTSNDFNIFSLSQGPESKAHSALNILSSSRLVNYFACVPESFY